jgi:hypothetical protein
LEEDFQRFVAKRPEENIKGCDIGYALAASSCEGPDNVDACTVTAFDVNTAFAVPNPNSFLAECVGFFGSECPLNRFTGPITQSTSAQLLFISTEPFDRRRERSYRKSDRCQHPWLVQTTKYFRVTGRSFQALIMRVLKSHEIFFHDLHSAFHNSLRH